MISLDLLGAPPVEPSRGLDYERRYAIGFGVVTAAILGVFGLALYRKPVPAKVPSFVDRVRARDPQAAAWLQRRLARQSARQGVR